MSNKTYKTSRIDISLLWHLLLITILVGTLICCIKGCLPKNYPRLPKAMSGELKSNAPTSESS